MSPKKRKALEERSREELLELVSSLQEEIERLKQQLGKTSKTSSKPPSSRGHRVLVLSGGLRCWLAPQVVVR